MSTTIFQQPTQSVFDLTLGRAVFVDANPHDSLVHVWWRCEDGFVGLVQVYVDEALADVSTHPDQRELWLVVDRTRSHRVELLAVAAGDPDALWRPRPDLLKSWYPPIKDRVTAKLLRDEALPIDTQIAVALDGEDVFRSALWPGDTPRSGFGGLLGLGGFGHDAATGLGLGRGELGFGPLGTDATAWRWQSDRLSPGPHEVTLAANDADGHEVTPPITLPAFTADALPTPARGLAVQPDFTLDWTD